ncbi:MAG: hypothetical protein EBZ77_15180, partial [Chitinophagia bacterium]|nr:hypothetical protein [Chitinophagia bacterium]
MSDYGFGTGTDRSKQGWFYQDKLHVQYTGNTIAYDTGSAFTAYTGTYIPADETIGRLKQATFRANNYLATSTGISKISNYGNTPAKAGVPQCLGYESRFTGNVASTTQRFSSNGRVGVNNSSFATGFVVGETVLCTSTDANFPAGNKTVIATNATGFTYLEATGVNATGTGTIYYQSVPLIGTSGFLAENYQCAYRFVLDIPDNNQEILLGPPSEKWTVKNVSGTVGYTAGQSK